LQYTASMNRGLVIAWLVACTSSHSPTPDDRDAAGPWEPPLGAHYEPDGSAVV